MMRLYGLSADDAARADGALSYPAGGVFCEPLAQLRNGHSLQTLRETALPVQGAVVLRLLG